MEKIIDKFIKKYSEDLRFYAIYENNGKIKQIYVFNKNGLNVAFINIFEYYVGPITVGWDITINKGLFNEVSSIIGDTIDRDYDSYEKNKRYFRIQFGNQISDKVRGYILQYFPNRRIMHPDTYLLNLSKKESEMVGKDNINRFQL